MKKLLLAISIIGVLIGAWSCSNELNLIDDWRNIPVVYALLSQADDVHYIRVEKAYLDPNTSAFTIAQIPDSIYYDNTVSVEIERTETGERVTLERVDGTDVGFERAEGIFANTPNILYRFNDTDLPLLTNKEYRLIITDGNSDQILTEASTQIVGPSTSLDSEPTQSIKLVPGSNVRVGWRNEDSESTFGQVEAAIFFDLRMRIHYRELNISDPSISEEKELEWVIEQNIERPSDNPRMNTTFNGTNFYEHLAASIEENPNVIRLLQSIDIIVDAGGQEIFDYINIGQANTGITSAQAIPTYTNLSEGKGIFSSRNQNTFLDYGINSEGRDSLRESSITRHLNFQ